METEYPGYPILGVGGIVFLDDKVVLVKRGKKPGYGTWSILGGTVKLGETMIRADSDVLDARAVPMPELSGYGLPEVTLEVIDKALYLLKQRSNQFLRL